MRGLIASARATARRRCSLIVMLPAGLSAMRSRLTNASHCIADSRAADTLCCVSMAAVITFSQAVMLVKVRAIWKVRPTPARAHASGGWPARSRSPSVIEPEVGAK